MNLRMKKELKTNDDDLEKQVKSKGFRKRIADRMDANYERKTAMVRARYINRWNDMCGGQYTLENPRVHLEWELCDTVNQNLLMKGKRQEFFERANLNDEEKELYLTGDCDGDPYTYIETCKLRKETGRAIKMVMKGKI